VDDSAAVDIEPHVADNRAFARNHDDIATPRFNAERAAEFTIGEPLPAAPLKGSPKGDPIEHPKSFRKGRWMKAS
jgi:hypothetical protein